MSISIYYNATRDVPLDEIERKAVDILLIRYSVDDEIEKYLRSGAGLNWESFRFTPSDEPEVILTGATKLPSNADEASRIGIQHWCKLLSEVRRVLPGATWSVRVENHKIQWDLEAMAYDPSK